MALLLTGFLVFLFGTTAAAVTGIVHPVLVALLGFLLLFVGGFVFSWSDLGSLQPQTAGAVPTSGPVRLVCPSCGAVLQRLDRSGVATCDYCATPLLVP